MDVTHDFAKLTEKLRSAKNLELPLKCLNTEEESFAYGLVSKALSYINQSHLEGSILLVMGVLLSNAEKAVLRRRYFKTAIAEDDIRDVKEFSEKCKEELPKVRLLSQKEKARIQMQVALGDAGLRIDIETLFKPTSREASLVKERFSATISQDILKQTESLSPTHEGDGLGLLLARTALQKAGIPKENFVFEALEGSMLFTLFVPTNPLTEEKLVAVDKRVLTEVEALPSFPEHISRLINLCQSDTSTAKGIAAEIAKDASLAGQIIKLANSGGFAGGKISDLAEAVNMIGLANLSKFLYSIGTLAIFQSSYHVKEDLMLHPVRVGRYAREIARRYKMAAVADLAYVGGLLHDIGKVLLYSKVIRPEEVEKVSAGRDHRILVNLEEISVGVSHAVIGGMLAKKWKFPPELCSAIEFHHNPRMAPEEHRKLVYCVYLANSIANFHQEAHHYYSVEPDVLGFFNLATVQAYEMVASTLGSLFKSDDVTG